MNLSRAAKYAVRLTVTQANSASVRQSQDRLVLPFAFLLAGIGLGLSSFSLKQLLDSRGARRL